MNHDGITTNAKHAEVLSAGACRSTLAAPSERIAAMKVVRRVLPTATPSRDTTRAGRAGHTKQREADATLAAQIHKASQILEKSRKRSVL